MTFKEWNDALVRRFFNESNDGKRIFLAVDEDLIVELAGPEGKADFISSVRAEAGASICRKAARAREAWRASGAQGIPPYVSYLALLVLAASSEGDYQNEGFQKRLHRLLGEEINSTPPAGFYDMWELWEDLEIWANEDNKGRLGILQCPLSGATPFVDQFCSQIVLTEGERARLPEVFADAELDPISPPAAEEIASFAIEHGGGRLRAKTLRRLSRTGGVDEDFRASTIESILEELRDWNGVAAENGQQKEFHTLRLNLRIIDRLSGRGESKLIAKDSEFFDEGELTLRDSSGQRTFKLAEFQNGWSSPLQDENGGPVDAASLDWRAGIRISKGSLVLKMPARGVRVFRDGQFDGVPGLLEASRLDPHREFYVAAEPGSCGQLEAWGVRAAEGWKEEIMRSGLPRGWRLFYGRRANPAIRAPAEFSVLRADPQTRIVLRGGIKLKATARRYFDFAPPLVQIEGLTPAAEVFVNDEPRKIDAGDTVLRFDEGPVPTTVKIRVSENGQPRCSATFQTVSPRDISWRAVPCLVSTSPTGSPSENGAGALARGAAVTNFKPPPLILGTDRTADLIGARVGQIVCVPPEALPVEWQPVWIVEHGRKRRAIFCGGDPAKCEPALDGKADRRRSRDWKRVLWFERKNLIGPTKGAAAALWIRYRDFAKNA